MGFRVWGLRFRTAEPRVQGLGIRTEEARVEDLGLRVEAVGLGFRTACRSRGSPGAGGAAASRALYPPALVFTTKSKVVVQSTVLTPRPNRFMRAIHPRGSRDPLRLAEGGTLRYAGARHYPGFSSGAGVAAASTGLCPPVLGFGV